MGTGANLFIIKRKTKQIILKEVFCFLNACWQHVAKANIASPVAGLGEQGASLVDVLCHVTKHQSELSHLLPFLPLLADKVTLTWKLVYLCESHLHHRHRRHHPSIIPSG